MKFNDYYWYVGKEIGIQELYRVPLGKLTATTVIAKCKDRQVTVSEMLSFSGYLLNYIKANFDVNVKKYSETLSFFKSLNSLLMNLRQPIPTKERLHYVVDVIHEIVDIQTQSNTKKRFNAKMAFLLNAMIDLVGNTEM